MALFFDFFDFLSLAFLAFGSLASASATPFFDRLEAVADDAGVVTGVAAVEPLPLAPALFFLAGVLASPSASAAAMKRLAALLLSVLVGVSAAGVHDE